MDAGVKVSIIAAVAENGVIGKGVDLPWRLKSDLQRFKRLTYGKTVIVGRKTHESILQHLGHPLPDRRTIVVTRQPRYASECEVTHSLDEALERIASDGEAFVIGGAELYRQALPRADRFYLTRVLAHPEGDMFFPAWDPSEWQFVSREECSADSANEHATMFEVWERRPAYVNLDYARFDDQRAILERIARDGVCPFCPANRRAGAILEPVWQGSHWVLVPNRWPYEFTTLHIVAITERHVRFPHELDLREWAELKDLFAWAVAHYSLRGGSVGMRFGDTAMTGATVDHLHVHLVVADPDTSQPGYDRVRFPMGPKPSDQKKSPDA